MRPQMISNATKVLVALLISLTTFASVSEARDRHGDRPVYRRHHIERNFHSGNRWRGDHERRSGVRIGGGVYREGRNWRGRRDWRAERPRDHYRDWRGRDRWRDRHNRGADNRYVIRRNDNYRFRYRDRLQNWGWRHGRGPAARGYADRYGNGYGSGFWPSYGGGEFPSQTDAGAYAGNLSAWTDPGNGTYFRSWNDGYVDYRNDYRRRGGPKIIQVSPSRNGNGCSWEAGVCVIRP